MKTDIRWLKSWLLVSSLLTQYQLHAQSNTANYVTNGGFEQNYGCVGFNYISNAVGWRSIDSSAYTSIRHMSTCYTYPVVPADASGTRYQWPMKGNSYALTGFLCFQGCPALSNRGYFRNRLKGSLVQGKTYCVKLFYNVTNNSNYGIDSFGAYFGDDNLDTISYVSIPLIYINPQVQNQAGNFATDTLNWSVLSGTFLATGNEKHMVIGNFKSDSLTGKVLIDPAPFIYKGLDMNIDHVSCMEIDLPAYAGPDKWFIPGDSVYLGRESDVEIDESCIWYQMTSPTTSITIDTIAGLWVKPVATTTYVVKQQLWCSGVKSDTVIVSLSGVGLTETGAVLNNIEIFPNPSEQYFQIRFNQETEDRFYSLVICNKLGQELRDEKIIVKNGSSSINTDGLPNGAYFVRLSNSKNESVVKKLLVAR